MIAVTFRPVHVPPPPYALAQPAFLFPALAQLAGRAPLGGAREVALAAFVAARLAAALLPPHALELDVRAGRAIAARPWLATLTLPATLRVPFARLVDATGQADAGLVATALERVQAGIAEHLDAPSRTELEQLARALHRIA
jgi:hypothetical protein